MEWVISHPIPSKEILRQGEVKRRYIYLRERSPSTMVGTAPSPDSQHCTDRAPPPPATAITQNHRYSPKTLSVTEM